MQSNQYKLCERFESRSYFITRWSMMVRGAWYGMGLLLTVTDLLTTCAVVIFRTKLSCITSVDGIKLCLLT